MNEQQKQSPSLDFPQKLGDYTLIRSLGKGGMGEVFLAEDAQCKRMVALKRIRSELQKFPSIRRRFLREARIAARLSHPTIVSIFSISDEPSNSFYTMPYIKGLTLKDILKEAKGSEHKGSISYLIRIFLTICQAVAYAHSKKILHRDLKPENIIIGKFGEVVILDWGLAEVIGDLDDLKSVPADTVPSSFLTRPGKVVGTLAYLTPERALGNPANEQTDLYALGVILFQILTLKPPFKRGNLELFQKRWKFEKVPNPLEFAPDRDIPVTLSTIVLKALNTHPESRYSCVNDLITDIEAFIEGRPDWTLKRELSMDCKEDWEFQELILLAKFMAISQDAEMEWVNLMISKASFHGNIKLETTVSFEEEAQGIGILVGLPSPKERKDLMEGYQLWIGSPSHPGIRLFRNNINILTLPSPPLSLHTSYTLSIEKNDHFIKLYINDALSLDYHLPSPLLGTNIGLLRRDTHLALGPVKISTGSQNARVSCLAIPDTFMMYKEYDKALKEYKKIELSFAGRVEGREATYKAGVTLIQKALDFPLEKDALLNHALDQFSRLRSTSLAPFEFLGKSLVYEALSEWEEESKCLELALRRYSNSPLLPRIVEHVAFRLHEASSRQRVAAYHLALLALRQIPQIFSNPDHHQILLSIQKEWEKLPYFLSPISALQLAFLLGNSLKIIEIMEQDHQVEPGFFALLELGEFDRISSHPKFLEYPAIVCAIDYVTKGVLPLPQAVQSAHLLDFLFCAQFDQGNLDLLLDYSSNPYFELRALLAQRRFSEAGKIFETFSLEKKTTETTPIFTLFGCYLWAVEGEEIAKAHFSVIHQLSYPPYTALLPHLMLGKIDVQGKWGKDAFLWEKISLTRQRLLLAYCLELDDQIPLLQEELKVLKTAHAND
ncbi:MAG: protein kinase [Candidatus Rhabdochlamydia sp.]